MFTVRVVALRAAEGVSVFCRANAICTGAVLSSAESFVSPSELDTVTMQSSPPSAMRPSIDHVALRMAPVCFPTTGIVRRTRML